MIHYFSPMLTQFEIIHSLGMVCFILLPLFVSAAWIQQYGIYPAVFMTLVITQWVVNQGECWMKSYEQNTNQYGTMAHVIVTTLKLNVNNSFMIQCVVDMLYCVSAFILASAHLGLQTLIIVLTIIFFIVYKAKPLANRLLVQLRHRD